MLVRKVEVKTYLYKAMCECGGEYYATGACLLSSPPKYEHLCSACKSKGVYTRKYPHQGIEEILT